MLERSTYYILDAQGNQLSMYDHKVTDNAVVYYLADRNIYGSSRLGSLRDTVNMFIPTNLPSYGVVGNRNYELSNHLGNVLAVVNDIVYPISDDSTTILSYEVGLTMVSDYSPFGVQLDGRTVENRMYSIKQNCYDSIVVDTSYIANIDFQNGSNGFISENCILSIKINIYTGERKLSLSKCNIPSPFPGFPSTTQDNKVYLNYTKEDNTTYYYEFDFSIGGCGSIDSVIFFEGLNFDYIQHLTSSGHYSGNFTVDGSGSSQVGFYFAGGSSCSSYLDNFKVYTISNSDTVEICNDVLLENNYLYGFNGMERDDKVKGAGNSYDYKKRMYDPRVGRFLSIDPLTKKFPFYSPYQFAGNKPTIAIDLDGLEEYIVIQWVDNDNKVVAYSVSNIEKAKSLQQSKYNGKGSLYITEKADGMTLNQISNKAYDILEKRHNLPSNVSTPNSKYFEEGLVGTQKIVSDKIIEKGWGDWQVKESHSYTDRSGRTHPTIQTIGITPKLNEKFAEGSSDLNSPSHDLQLLGQWMNLLENANIKLVGYTNSNGESEDNQKLSLDRARAIKNYLVKEFGVDASRITIAGEGENDLKYKDGKEDKVNSRRTEVESSNTGIKKQ